jgi:hypothetical protein
LNPIAAYHHYIFSGLFNSTFNLPVRFFSGALLFWRPSFLLHSPDGAPQMGSSNTTSLRMPIRQLKKVLTEPIVYTTIATGT